MQDDQGRVVFPGAGPFVLPAAQRATAIGGSNGVEATLYCLIPEKGPLPQPIRVQMTYGLARRLGDDLMTAAVDAELASRRR
jgi:hypothetical protein